jgi:hypothetical protein
MFMVKVLTFLLAFLCGFQLFADTYHLESVTPLPYPQMKVSFFPVASDGKILSPTIGNFSASIDGKPLTIASLNCPTKNSIQLSLSIVVDVSGSMSSGAPNMLLAKNIATKLLENIDKNSEIAVTAFDDNAMIIHPLSTNLQGVQQSIELLKPSGGTNYQAAFFDSFSGAFEVLKSATHKKVVVFITDGYGSLQENEVITKAKQESITIVCISVGMKIPETLKKISINSGGRWFESIKSIDQSTVAAAISAYQFSNNTPCSFVVNFEGDCSPTALLEVRASDGSVTNLPFDVPIQFRTGIEIVQPHIDFPNTENSNTQFIQIQNGVKPTTIPSITSKRATPAFQIDKSLFPLQLLPNELKKIPITYSKTDGKSYERYTIASTNCSEKTVVVSAGTGKITTSAIQVVFPNGSERFLVSSDTLCKWDGISPDQKVNVDISLDKGKSWQSLAKNVSGNSLHSSLSNQPSTQALLRVSLVEEVDTKGGLKKRNQEYDYVYSENDFVGIDDFIPYEKGQKFIKVTSTLGSVNSDVLKNTLSIIDVDTKSGKERTLLEFPKGRTLRSLFLSPDSKKLVVSVGSFSNGSVNSFFCVDMANGKTLFQNNLITFQPNLSTVYNQKKNQIFSPDGTKLVAFAWTMNQKSPVKILNSSTGATVTEFQIEEATDNGATYVTWSPNSKEIVFGDPHNNTFSIWNVQIAKKVFSYSDPTCRIKNVSYSSDGKFLVCQGVDSLLRIFDATTKTLKKEIVHSRDSRGRAIELDYELTPDGASLLVWKPRGKGSLGVYELSSGNQVIEIGNGLDVSSVAISPNSELVAVQYSSKSPENGVFNLITGEKEGQIGIIIEPNPRGPKYSDLERTLSKIQWADNSQLLAKVGKEWGSRTEKDRIIRFSAMPFDNTIASDVSDNVWELYSLPTLSVLPASLVFNDVAVGSSKENIFTALMTSPKQGFVVDSVWIENDNEKVFTIVSNSSNEVVDSDEGSLKLEIRFSPTLAKDYTAKVKYRVQGLPTILESSLIGKAIETELVITEKIDFGKVPYDTTKIYEKSIILQNKSSMPIEIKSILLNGPDTTQFRTNFNVPITISPKKTDSISVLFRPIIGGKTSTQFFTVHTAKGEVKKTTVIAEVDTAGFNKTEYTDPTTFRSFAIPNAIIPKEGTITVGSYMGLGLIGGYSVTDNIQIIGGGVAPLPDDWFGLNGSMFGGGGLGVKFGGTITENLSIAAGVAAGMSFFDSDVTPDTTESVIRVAAPFFSLSFGNDKQRISTTFGYGFKRHTAIPPEGGAPVEFDRDAVVLTLGGDYSFAERWKITGEIISVTTSGYVPIISTIRYFGHSWAIDIGLTYLGIKNTPDATDLSIPILPVLSWVMTF